MKYIRIGFVFLLGGRIEGSIVLIFYRVFGV